MVVPSVFNFANFILRYPEFSSLSSTLLQMYFNEAGFYCRNDGVGPVEDQATLDTFMSMLTAHIAALNGGVNGQAPSQLVGRINSAGEGSVRVSTEMKTDPGAAWFMQTKYGAAYWQASLPYRLGGRFVIATHLIQRW